MKHSFYANKILQNTIWITGCARTGTTILGKILSTLNNVEYGYEPETLFGLLPLVHNVKKKYWKDIYENYLIEDLFFNLCIGRRINLKKNEDSSIYHSLSKNQIKKKLKLNLRRKDFDFYLKKNKKDLIIKVPDLARSLVKLQKYYPQNRFIVTRRNDKAVTASLKKKGWFKKKGTNSTQIHSNKYWIEPGLYKVWINSNEKEKIKIYISTVEKYLKKIKNKHVVDYENLIKNPNKVINGICNYLNLKRTYKTKEIIGEIYSR